MKQNEELGTEVTVPHLAESLVSATVGKWLKQPGDYIREYDVLCELMTDKVNVEMPSPIAGTLIRILAHEGETACVGAPICIIRQPSAQAPEPGGADDTEVFEAADGLERKRRPRYSPAVLKLAQEHRIDVNMIKGTGLGGRITRKDVLTYIRNAEVEETAPAPSVPEHEVPEAGVISSDERIVSVTPLRNIIASRMRQSVSEIPHAWLMVEADVSNLVDLRQRLKDRFMSEEGVRLTFTPFIVKAVVNAIKDYPILNSTWDSDKIVIKKDVHMSIAIGSEDSVIAPVIRNADRKTIAGLAIELDDMVKKAKNGKLTLADVQGGTFTFNNTGSFGSLLSYPIINYPQAAIITFESIVRKPVVIQEMIAIRSMANLCLSLDHRVLDGMVCGHFMQRVKYYLERYDQSSVIY